MQEDYQPFIAPSPEPERNIFDDFLQESLGYPYVAIPPVESSDSSSDSESTSSSSSDEDPTEAGISKETRICYLSVFYSFWKWLHKHHAEIVVIEPPSQPPISFGELRSYSTSPVIIEKLTPEIFLEYTGSFNIQSYRTVTYKLRQPLRRIADIFDKKDIFDKLFVEIRDFKIIFEIKKAAQSLPPAKRRRVIEDDKPKTPDHKDDPKGMLQNFLVMKHLMYKQWEMMEKMTPGMKHVNVNSK